MATVNTDTKIKINEQYHVLPYGQIVKVNCTIGADCAECEVVFGSAKGIVNTKTLDFSVSELKDLNIPTSINGKPLLKGTRVRFVGPSTSNLKENDVYYVYEPYDTSRSECKCYKDIDLEYMGQVVIPHNKLEVF